MKTFYVDVYFLINFTIDALALYFSSVTMRVPTNAIRLSISAVLGSIYAILCVFIENMVIKCVLGIVFFFMIAAFAKSLSLYRRIKFLTLFIVYETWIGGAVFYAYSILDKYINTMIDTGVTFDNRREILILAIIILLSYGVFKLYISIFSKDANAKSVRVAIKIENEEHSFEAFVDSGNLATDPIDMTPVTLINSTLSKKILPSYANCEELSSMPGERQKRIRFVPIIQGQSKRLLLGVRPDEVYLIIGNKREQIKTVLVIEKNEGTYGGYDALIPSSVVRDVI